MVSNAMWWVYGLSAFIVVLAIYIHYLFNKVKRLNAKLTRANETLAHQQSEEYNIECVKHFINEHKDQSKQRYRSQADTQELSLNEAVPIDIQYLLLRAYYLKAELIALNWLDTEDKYWLSLQKSLKQIYHNLGIEQLQQSIKHRNIVIKKLKQRIKLLEPNQPLEEISQESLVQAALENIGDIQDNLTVAQAHNQDKLKIIENLNKHASKTNASDTIKAHINALTKPVEIANQETELLKDKIKALSNEIEFLKNLKTEANKPSSDFNNLHSNQSMLTSDTKQVFEHQLLLLRENNDEQRAFIIKLRTEINDLEEKLAGNKNLPQHEVQQYLNEIAHFERMIAEFEHCIFSLESEIELLQEQIQSLNPDKNNDETALARSVDNAQSSQELHDMQLMIDNAMQMYNDQSVLTELAIKSAQCKTIVDLMLVINQTMETIDVTCAFHIRTEITNNKSVPPNLLAPLEEQLLTNPEAPNSGVQFPIGDKMFFWDRYITIIVAKLPAKLERKTQTIDNIALIKKMLSSEIQRIEMILKSDRQQKTLQRLLKATQQEIADIQIQQKQQASEYTEILSSVDKQIRQLKQLPNLPNEAQIMLDSIVKESEVRSEILLSTTGIVSTGFNKLISSLESKLNKEEASNV